MKYVYLFFFFQAEDGIRDLYVTGVQTCALPISLSTMQAVVEEEADPLQHAGPLAPVIGALLRKDPATRPDAATAEQMLAEAAEGRRPRAARSEERRVGKECRARWSAGRHEKKHG